MSKRRTIELGNLVVLFGGRGLVDNFRDRFLPAIATYDDQDRLLQMNLNQYNNNANGEMIQRVHGLTNATLSLTYNPFGFVKSITKNSDTKNYLLDSMNRRIKVSKNNQFQKYFVYQDELRLAAELDHQLNIAKRFVYGTKSHVPDYFIAGTEKYRIISDNLGSPRLVIRVSDGQVMQRMNHDEFGRVIEDSNPGFTPFGFAGGLYDAETGLVRFGAREYDAEIGRWLSKDPILFAGGDTNLFGYVANDPINFIDPIGLWGFGVIGGGSAEGGIGVIGGGATGSVGGGIFGGGSGGINFGGFAGGGAFAGGPGYGMSTPTCQDNKTGAAGAFAGVGAGPFITNATSPSDLANYSNTYSFNLGVGPIKFSLQFGQSGNTWIGSATFGPGIGLSGSTYPTWTNTTH